MTRLALTWVCGCVTIALALNGPTVTVTGEREEQESRWNIDFQRAGFLLALLTLVSQGPSR